MVVTMMVVLGSWEQWHTFSRTNIESSLHHHNASHDITIYIDTSPLLYPKWAVCIAISACLSIASRDKLYVHSPLLSSSTLLANCRNGIVLGIHCGINSKRQCEYTDDGAMLNGLQANGMRQFVYKCQWVNGSQRIGYNVQFIRTFVLPKMSLVQTFKSTWELLFGHASMDEIRSFSFNITINMPDAHLLRRKCGKIRFCHL